MSVRSPHRRMPARVDGRIAAGSDEAAGRNGVTAGMAG